MVIRMALVTTERLFWHCGAHTAEPNIGLIRLIPLIPYYQNVLFSMARGGRLSSVATGQHASARGGRAQGETLPVCRSGSAPRRTSESSSRSEAFVFFSSLSTSRSANATLACWSSSISRTRFSFSVSFLGLGFLATMWSSSSSSPSACSNAKRCQAWRHALHEPAASAQLLGARQAAGRTPERLLRSLRFSFFAAFSRAAARINANANVNGAVCGQVLGLGSGPPRRRMAEGCVGGGAGRGHPCAHRPTPPRA